MIILSSKQIIALHSQLISETGGTNGIRNEGLLSSALNAPFQSFGDIEVYPSLFSLLVVSAGCEGVVTWSDFVFPNNKSNSPILNKHLAVNALPYPLLTLHPDAAIRYFRLQNLP